MPARQRLRPGCLPLVAAATLLVIGLIVVGSTPEFGAVLVVLAVVVFVVALVQLFRSAGGRPATAAAPVADSAVQPVAATDRLPDRAWTHVVDLTAPPVDEDEYPQDYLEVSGESHHLAAYRPVLDKLPGVRDENGAETQVVAVLAADRSNPHDPDAVAVWINDRHAGFLSRDDAQDWGYLLGDATAVAVPARVWGSTARGSWGVRCTLTVPAQDDPRWPGAGA